MTPKQIEAALKAGIIDQKQAAALQAKHAAPNDTSAHVEQAALIGNEDDMRFLRSFSDVFIGMGVGILALGFFVMNTVTGEWASLTGAIVMWLMAEFFGRQRRAHFPTLVCALWFLFFVHLSAASFVPGLDSLPGFIPAAVTVVAMLVFYWRIRLPFAIALIAISLAVLVYSLVYKIVDIGPYLLVSGFVFFGTALAYDARDTDRQTRFADNAFWLHFTAAPLILHGIALSVLSLSTERLFNVIPVPSLDKTDAVIMLCIIGVLAIIGLAINRRALLVSSFGYAGFSLAMLIKTTGLGLGNVAVVTLLLLGGGIVFLGAGWHGARRGLLKLLPSGGIFDKVFPPAK